LETSTFFGISTNAMSSVKGESVKLLGPLFFIGDGTPGKRSIIASNSLNFQSHLPLPDAPELGKSFVTGGSICLFVSLADMVGIVSVPMPLGSLVIFSFGFSLSTTLGWSVMAL